MNEKRLKHISDILVLFPDFFIYGIHSSEIKLLADEVLKMLAKDANSYSSLELPKGKIVDENYKPKGLSYED